MSDLAKLMNAVLDGDQKTASAETRRLLDAGADPQELLGKALIPAMDEVGKRFECNEYFVPELLIAARAMKASMEHIRPLLVKSGVKPIGRVAIGTVKGDLHDIGKNLVASMLEGGGFEIIDLGVDVPADKFVQVVKDGKADLLALSALLTTTMPAMKDTIQALEAAGVRGKVKVMVGGAPITDQYAKQIGADGFGESALGAVQIARKLIAQAA